MAKLTEDALKNAIQTDSYLPVYVLYGEEQYLIQHWVNQLTSSLVGGAMPDFNLSRLPGETTGLADICQAAEIFPVMHSHRCVLVHDFSPQGEDAASFGAWEAYLADPCPGNVVIFSYSSVTPGSTDKWKRFLAPCEAHGGVLKFSVKTPQELARMLAGGAAKRGCRMSVSAASYLVDCVGDDMNTLLGELEKLCAYKMNQEITEADVDRLCPKTLSATAFQMIRQINSKNSRGALTILANLFQMREDPLKIFGALASSYVNMYRALIASQAGLAPGSFGKELGMKNTNGLSYSLKDAHTLGEKKLDQSLAWLSDCDQKLKSLPVDPHVILEQTVVGLLSIAGARYD